MVERKRGQMKKQIAIFAALLVLFASDLNAKEIQFCGGTPVFQQMECTAYCDGYKCADGTLVRVGVCSTQRKNWGKKAIIYQNKNGKLGRCIGVYECHDTGGRRIKAGEVIDIYNPSYDWCMNFGSRKVFVLFVD